MDTPPFTVETWLAASALSGLCVTPAFAQQYKTDVPPAIVTPDSVETRLGTLTFTDAFPDEATVQKVYDNLDFQRRVQAFLIVIIFETLMDSRSLYPTANTSAFTDAEAGRSTAATPTGCVCRRTSRRRIFGRSCSTTIRRARCSRPISSSPASAAKRRGLA